MNPVARRTFAGLTVGLGVIAFILFAPLAILGPVLLVLSTLLQLEFYQMAKRYEPVTWFGLLAGAAWIILTAAFPGTTGFATCAIGLVCAAPLAAFALACIVLFSSKRQHPIGSMAVTALGFAYVPFLLSFFLRMVQLAPDLPTFGMPGTRAGLYTLFTLIAIAKFSDTGGFALGVAFGRHKMCPAISPKKSWEGLAGSVVFASATALVFWGLATWYGWGEFCHVWRPVEWPIALAIGGGLAFVATAGDLIESRFKRECGVKDSATFMPAGMGGFLDMFDSFIFLPAIVYPIELALFWLGA